VANFKVTAIGAIRIKRLRETAKISGFNVYWDEIPKGSLQNSSAKG
jgi:hypothetical protein